jgi:hypothetical protein
MSEINETGGLGNDQIPAGFGQPAFGLGTASSTGPGPDQKLIAQSAAGTPNGIDPLNRGFSIGGADDPLAEFEKALNNPPGLDIGGGRPATPMNSPSHPAMASMREGDDPFGEEFNPFAGDDDFLAGEEDLVFGDADALPAFEDIADDPDIAGLPVDASGVIEPVVVPDEIIPEPELGEMPDVALPFEEPVLEISEEDVDIQIPENVFENNGIPESIPVKESFKLPENQRIIVSKGDQIFMLGHVREEFTPKFAESAFARALKSLAESKEGGGHLVLRGRKMEKTAVVGRSVLVEVAKDWRLPGTNTVFEAHDLLQIVSAKPVREADETDNEENAAGGKKKDKDNAKTREEAEEEKLKREAMLAYKRWREAKKKKEGDDDDDDDDKNDTPEGKAKKERAKREAAMLKRQQTGGWL